MAEYGGKVMKYPHYRTSDLIEARFCVPSLIKVGRNDDQYVLTSAFLGSEIAPVGDCHNMHIELLLTQDGRLIGFADYMLLYWETLSPGSWRKSIQMLLEGIEPVELGVVE